MQNVLFPHMEWAKAQAGKRVPTPLGFSGAPSPRRQALVEHGPAEGELVRRIARRYGVPRDHVYLVGGTSLANFLALAALADPRRPVLVETPRYAALGEIPRGLGCRVTDLPRGADGRLPPLPPGSRLAVVSSPHNPTGAVLDKRDWKRLARFADGGGVVIVDEVYRDLQPRPPAVAAARHPRFLTTASFTKSYGLGALRLGWILGAPDLLGRIARVDNLVSVAVAMPSVLETLRAWPRLERLRGRAMRHVAKNLATLGAAGLRFPEPGGGLTAFVDVGDGDAVAARLAREGVAVVRGSFFGAPRGVRIFLGAPPAVFRRGVRALARAAGVTGRAGRSRRRSARSGA